MSLSEHIADLLNSEQLSQSWHLNYGISKDRVSSLTSKPQDKNSFLNPKSETATTLFILGNMGQWIQVNRSGEPPRNSRGWNPAFFESICRRYANSHTSLNVKTPLRSWIANLLNISVEATDDGVLLFECEMRNSALSVGNDLCPISFLETAQQSWCLQDAIVLLPKIKCLVVIESKLCSDLSRSTSEFPLISQAIRGWESAFLLTRGRESFFHGWDFKSILLCPRKSFEYQGTYYSFVFRDPTNHVAQYKNILENEYSHKMNRELFDNYFEEFQASVSTSTYVVFWDDLARQISLDENWIDSYLSQVQEVCRRDGNAIYNAAANRFRLAGIEI